jgi:transposase-like protein
VVGRETGRVKLGVVANSDGGTLERTTRRATEPGTRLNTDEWKGYDGLPAMNRPRSSVCHAAGEHARDDDGDGVREVHCNTMEGLWAGLRNFLRPFRGVHKRHLNQYVAMFEWSYNVKRVTATFIRAMLGVESADGLVFTRCPS